jgi:hypothetical protein
MKNAIKTLFLGKDLLSSVLAMMIVASIVLGCTCGKNFDLGNTSSNSSSSNSSSDGPFGDDSEDTSMPDDALLKALVKSTTASFANAISTEDFSTIYNDASEDFKKTYTEQQMKDVFKDFISKKRQVLPILAKAITLEPDFAEKPSIRTQSGNDILVVDGKYTTKPLPMKVHYEYVKRGGQWKLLILKVFIT